MSSQSEITARPPILFEITFTRVPSALRERGRRGRPKSESGSVADQFERLGGEAWWGGEKGAKSEPGGPKWHQKGSKNEVWRPFGAVSKLGRKKDAKKVPTFGDRMAQGLPKWSQN